MWQGLAPADRARGKGTMPEYRKQRRVPRIALPGQPAARSRATETVRLLDLSLNGARIEHLNILRPGGTCTVELSPPLGGLHLSAQVVWSRVVGTEAGSGGSGCSVTRAGHVSSGHGRAEHGPDAGPGVGGLRGSSERRRAVVVRRALAPTREGKRDQWSRLRERSRGWWWMGQAMIGGAASICLIQASTLRERALQFTAIPWGERRRRDG